MNRTGITIGIWVVLILATLSSQAQIKLDTTGLNKLKGSLKAMANDDALKHANWGFCLMDPSTNTTLAEYNSEKSLTPASSMKVLTTVAALNLLGSDHRFETFIESDVIPGSDSILHGNIYIRGTGDPTLGALRIDSAFTPDSLLNVWTLALRKKGIAQINGNIIADASYFEDYTTVGSWNWDDIGQYYGAGASGLNFMENAYTIYYSSNKTTAHIDSVLPVIDGLTIWNDVKVAGSGDEAYIYGAPDNYYRYVTGTIPANRKAYPVDGSMPDPPLHLALTFKQTLIDNGIPVSGNAETIYAMKRAGIEINTNRKLLYTHRSVPVSEIVKHTNLKSNNLYAECLLKAIGKKQLGEGSRAAGARSIEGWYALKGLGTTGLHVEDGSGLSRLNYFTPSFMCALLSMEMKQSSYADFQNSLPVAGRTGTLKTFADNTIAEGKVFAKSGSMYKVRSYSGYVRTKSGTYLPFCVIVNNYSCGSTEIKSILEKLMVYMAGI